MQLDRKFPTLLDRYYGWIVIAAIALLYAPLIAHWYDGWLNKNISLEHEYFSHGLIGLPFAAYIAWTDTRSRWRRLSEVTHPLAVPFLITGGIFYLSGLPDFTNLSFPLVLIGVCLWFKGIPGLKLEKFPLLLVILATPNEIPYLISPYTLPLQSFIASCAGFILTHFDVPVTVEQIYLYVNDKIVEVAPHCSGLKMLLTSLYVALMLLYWTGTLTSRGKTLTFLGSTVILSVTANIIRNTLLTFFHGTGREQIFAWLHEGWGGDLYSACMLGLLIPLLGSIEWIADYFHPGTDLEEG
ncbi:cyanoexosortase B [Oxynema sp. CENA135]|uniref:cyanoexosortase B n=1 Tax=Oxynema sp. CENA135 TaxID=984206 RepID=UPI00190BA5DC|nr:cyanoexosortase B [Oxynema sp. CENA135]MBK4730099.1 cyanoexosortase B [Oxynema sp. CENA135]